jgi:fructokinase
VKLAKGKEPQYVFYTEGAADRSLSAEELPAKLPADTRCILFGSIAMTMEPVASAIEALILKEGTRKSADQMDGAPVISFDPNIRPFMIKDKNSFLARFEKLVAASTIAKISSADFEFLYPKMDPEKALHKILAMGPRLAISTLGSKGALALLRRNDGSVIRVSAPVIDLHVVDTIGAGDTFHGAFLSWLEIKAKMSRSALAGLSETDLYDALFFANKAASIVCSRRGAAPPSLREVESLKQPEAKAVTKPADAKKSGVKTMAAKPVLKKTASAKSASKKPVAAKTSSAKTAAKKPVPKKQTSKKQVSSKPDKKSKAIGKAAVQQKARPAAKAVKPPVKKTAARKK